MKYSKLLLLLCLTGTMHGLTLAPGYHGKHHKKHYRGRRHHKHRKHHHDNRGWWHGLGAALSGITASTDPYWRTGQRHGGYYGPNQSYNFWEVTNSTPAPISVTTSFGTQRIHPGQRARLQQTPDGNVTVYAHFNGQTHRIRTGEPYLDVVEEVNYYNQTTGRFVIRPYSPQRARY